MTFQKLKPCPWCGRPTKLINYGDLYFVTCDDATNKWMNCGRVVTTYYQSIEDAVTGWNNEETLNAIRIEDIMDEMLEKRRSKERAMKRKEAVRAFRKGLE